ncbi:MAG: type IX secretion system sortase PorU, partial [Melioribacteraceae bacterium]|nr:type IX secretion system sortase PorU [Melioribacteraceae bacterium]
MKKNNNFILQEYKVNAEYKDVSNKEIVTFGEFGKIRDLNVQQIKIMPIHYDFRNEEIKLFDKIVIKINFPPNNQKEPITESDITRNLVVNYDIAKKWSEEEKVSKVSLKNSVLSEGEWFRFEIPEEGIYKIDRSYLSNLGINVDNVDPRTIKIYNNGGYILPWSMSSSNSTDLNEIAILIEGESDGSFNNNDRILFYARGLDFWEYSDITDKIKRNKHFYSKSNYYWITFGGSQGKRVNIQPNINGTPFLTKSTTKAYKFQDIDNQNLIGSGLLYVEDDYTNTSKTKTYMNMLEGLKNGTEINYTFQFVNGSTRSNNLTVHESGNTIYSRFIPGASSWYQDYRYGALSKGTASFNGTLIDNRSALKFTYNPSTISDKGHLDYIEIEYIRDMNSSIADIPLIFFSDQVNGLIEYRGSPFNNSNFKIFNVSDFSNTKLVDAEYNGGGYSFRENVTDSTSSKYIAVHDDDILIPANAEKINNSNIHGYAPGAKYVIITASEFLEQAERLKNYRTFEATFNTSGYVVLIDEIYNEFSGGTLDPTAIRNFLSYAYDTWEIKPEYVLLFGDGDFDYFNVLDKGLNFIPTFQTTESLFEIDSYPYDDYYSRISGNDNLADIGIGRLSVTTPQEAKIVVDKIIYYETTLNKGLWRNKITLLADDGLTSEGNDGSIHTRQSENLSLKFIPDNFDRNKIYLSNFQTVNTGLGRRKPDCNLSVIDAINNGTLIFNFVGHGNPDVWAHEIVFDRSVSIPQLRNNEYFFLTAAKCDFGKYDDPNLQSATEEMILMENAGMIGGLSAVRPVFSSSNAALNQEFYKQLLGEKDSQGFPIPVGLAYMRMKQVRTADNDQKFHLFADPMLRLNIPKLPVEITSINNAGINDTVNIKALGEVEIKGKVFNSDSSDAQYQGEGIITVFDSERSIFLDDINFTMTDQGGVIFRGRVSVENGEFATSFTVPKDISYENKNGKIIAYFFNDELDGIGHTSNIIVGGTDSSKTNDGSGPEIEIFYDNENESSYLVGPNFRLRVKLYDETGLNTTGTGIGHKLEAILNDDEQGSIDLTNFFVGDLNSGGKSGEVNYNFSALEPGEYKIKINAWDVYNNFSSKEDFFTVVDENDLVVREVFNYPNPFSSNTYFTFQHNLTD